MFWLLISCQNFIYACFRLLFKTSPTIWFINFHISIFMSTSWEFRDVSVLLAELCKITSIGIKHTGKVDSFNTIDLKEWRVKSKTLQPGADYSWIRWLCMSNLTHSAFCCTCRSEESILRGYPFTHYTKTKFEANCFGGKHNRRFFQNLRKLNMQSDRHLYFYSVHLIQKPLLT